MRFLNHVDVIEWLKTFNYKTSYDYDGDKRYFCFDDTKRGGKYTLMKYEGGTFTLHSKGENYCDDKEIEIGGNEWVSLFGEIERRSTKPLRSDPGCKTC